MVSGEYKRTPLSNLIYGKLELELPVRDGYLLQNEEKTIGKSDIEVMHKVWHYVNTFRPFEWLTLYTK